MKVLQRWRPLRENDQYGHLRGMRQDRGKGEYMLAADMIAEMRYLLDQLAEFGWQDTREGLEG